MGKRFVSARKQINCLSCYNIPSLACMNSQILAGQERLNDPSETLRKYKTLPHGADKEE